MYVTAKKKAAIYPAVRQEPRHYPYLFEYVYFAWPDSFIDKFLVYSSRVRIGQMLSEKIAREWEDFDIVIPIPETSCDIALEIVRILNKVYCQGVIKTVTSRAPLSCPVSRFTDSLCP